MDRYWESYNSLHSENPLPYKLLTLTMITYIIFFFMHFFPDVVRKYTFLTDIRSFNHIKRIGPYCGNQAWDSYPAVTLSVGWKLDSSPPGSDPQKRMNRHSRCTSGCDVAWRGRWGGAFIKWWEFLNEVVRVAVPAAAVVVVMEVAVGTVPHTAAADVAEVGCAVVTRLSLVSGRQGRYKALCSCLGPSSKPHLKGTWSSICSKGNNHNNWTGSVRVQVEKENKKWRDKWWQNLK